MSSDECTQKSCCPSAHANSDMISHGQKEINLAICGLLWEMYCAQLKGSALSILQIFVSEGAGSPLSSIATSLYSELVSKQVLT